MYYQTWRESGPEYSSALGLEPPKRCYESTLLIISIIRSSNKIKYGHILLPANPGPPEKWPLKRRENTLTLPLQSALNRHVSLVSYGLNETKDESVDLRQSRIGTLFGLLCLTNAYCALCIEMELLWFI